MTTRAEWMREQLLEEPNQYEVVKRRSLEAVLRVQRSVQRLSVPDWYLANNTKREKLLKFDIPIDRRRTSWRDSLFFENSDYDITAAERNITSVSTDVSTKSQEVSLNTTWTRHDATMIENIGGEEEKENEEENRGEEEVREKEEEKENEEENRGEKEIREKDEEKAQEEVKEEKVPEEVKEDEGEEKEIEEKKNNEGEKVEIEEDKREVEAKDVTVEVKEAQKEVDTADKGTNEAVPDIETISQNFGLPKTVLTIRKGATLPKISASRKISNINIVLPPRVSPIPLDSVDDFDSPALKPSATEEVATISTTALISEDVFDKTQTAENDSMIEASMSLNLRKHIADTPTTTYEQIPRNKSYDTLESLIIDYENWQVCASSTPLSHSPVPTAMTKPRKQTTLWLMGKLKSLWGKAQDDREDTKSNNESRGYFGVITKTDPGALPHYPVHTKEVDITTSKFKNIVKIFKIRGQPKPTAHRATNNNAGKIELQGLNFAKTNKWSVQNPKQQETRF